MENVLALVDAFLIVAFSLVLGYLGKERFEAMDRRFEAMDRRFEAMDRRFDRLEQRLDSGLDAVRADITRLALTLVPPREER
jgi:hypothetical protein